jgi:hypothetical protein
MKHNTQPTRPKTCVLDVFAWQSQHYYKELFVLWNGLCHIWHDKQPFFYENESFLPKSEITIYLFIWEIEVILDEFQSPKVRKNIY